MPFLTKFSYDYLLCVSLLPEFRKFLDKAVRHLVGALGRARSRNVRIPVGPFQLRMFPVLSIQFPSGLLCVLSQAG